MKLRILILSLIICPQLSWGQIITTVAGSGPYGGAGTGTSSGDGGPATLAGLNNPESAAVDAYGNIIIADHNGYDIMRKVDTNGIINEFCGNGTYGYYGDDIPATDAAFSEIAYIFIYNNNVYLPDALNRYIRAVNQHDTIFNVAGTGIEGHTGDGGPATVAKLGTPIGIGFDKWGNMYYADESYCCIRKIDTNGIISTIAGTGTPGKSGDGGPATNAELYYPCDIAVDFTGNIYFPELGNNDIRKVDTNGIITTYAGTDSFGYTGDHGAATLATMTFPEGITVDGIGNVFFADCWNNVIRKIDTTGNITTVVGNGYGSGTNGTIGGFSGDNGPAIDAELFAPAGIRFDTHGNLFIADWYNNRIRKVTNVGVPLEVRGVESGERREAEQYKLMPNPNNGNFILTQLYPDIDPVKAEIWNSIGENVWFGNLDFTSGSKNLNIANLSSGLYLLKLTDHKGNNYNIKFIKE